MIVSVIGSILFIFVIVLYLLLLQGQPLGEYALGGKYKVLPRKARAVCLAAILIQIFAMLILLQGGGVINMGIPGMITRIACFVFAAYFSLNIVMNLMSKSKKEKAVMTPLSAIVAVCFWITAIGI